MSNGLAVLLLVWAVLLVPGALRSRNASPHATVGGFERAMDVLRSDRGSRHGREVLVPRDAGRIVERPVDTTHRPLPRRRQEDPVVARRRMWFVRGLVGTVTALLLALVVGGLLWLLFLVSAVATGGYVALLRRLKLQRDEARRVVRELDLGRVVLDHHEDVAVGQEGGPWVVATGAVRLRRWDD